jgi:chemotaxis protein CheD
VAENLRVVFIGDIVVSDAADDVLVAYGLGSCVAVCLYDPVARVGGMMHALLPTAPRGGRASEQLAKFVDRGVPLLVEAVTAAGGLRSRLITSLCGGAQLLTAYNPQSEIGLNGRFHTGKLNVLAAEAALGIAGLQIRARSTGGRAGRTVRLYVGDGRITVKTLGRGEQVLNYGRVGWPK